MMFHPTPTKVSGLGRDIGHLTTFSLLKSCKGSFTKHVTEKNFKSVFEFFVVLRVKVAGAVVRLLVAVKIIIVVAPTTRNWFIILAEKARKFNKGPNVKVERGRLENIIQGAVVIVGATTELEAAISISRMIIVGRRTSINM